MNVETGKSKFDMEMDSFEQAFSSKKNLKIVIYGTGRMTATLMTYAKGYRIIGLCDRDINKLNTQMYGVNIVDQEFVEKNADLLIINTSESYWYTIYQRIKDWKIPIYYRNGELAHDDLQAEDNAPYWNQSIEELREKIKCSEVVSFDIFDTLITRRLVSATDIFSIVEDQLNYQFGTKLDYIELRKKAASQLDNPTFDEIYDRFTLLSGWGQDKIDAAKEMEWETEKELIVSRKNIVSLYQSIADEKEVYFISDMYFSVKAIQLILLSNGIEISSEHILVSCELKKTKAEGNLWDYYQKNIVKGRKAIHIGDDKTADVLEAERHGIQAYHIQSPVAMLEKSSLRNVLPHVQSVYSSVVLGSIASKICNDPFALNRSRGKIKFETLDIAGYCLWGNVIYCFFTWLENEIKRESIQKIAFFAREGYLLVPLFQKYLEHRELKDLSVIYLEISRRAVFTAAIVNMDDIREVGEFPYSGSLADFFEDRYNVKIEEPELGTLTYSEAKENPKLLKGLFEKYQEEILYEANREKRNYLTYLKSCELDDNFAVVDSQLYGSTQYYLSKICGKKISGYYMCTCEDESNRYKKYNNMKGCFTGLKGIGGKDSNLYRHMGFTESFFTAPHGMLKYIDESGKVYSEKKNNQIFYDVRFKMGEGIEEFLNDMYMLCQQFHLKPEEKDCQVADLLYGEFLNGGFIPSDQMKKSFYYDNGIAGNREVPLWE